MRIAVPVCRRALQSAYMAYVPGNLHAEEERVRGKAVEHELAGIGVLPLITLQGKVEQAQPHEGVAGDDEEDGDGGQPRRKLAGGAVDNYLTIV